MIEILSFSTGILLGLYISIMTLCIAEANAMRKLKELEE